MASPVRLNGLATLALLVDQALEPCLQALQVFAVEARYEESPYPLPAARLELLLKREALLRSCEAAIESLAPFDPSDSSSGYGDLHSGQ